MKWEMDQYISNNKHVKHIEKYINKCSIGDWFVLYMMNKNMNKRFFAEFLSNLSLKVKIIVHIKWLNIFAMHFKIPYKVNPLPEENDDPEINIIKESMNDDDANYVDLDENGEDFIYLGILLFILIV